MQSVLNDTLLMKVVYDNIIFSLQRCGGISVVWGKLLNHIMSHGDVDVVALEGEDACSNIVRKELTLDGIALHSFKTRLMALRRWFNPSVPSDVAGGGKFIFHSSYYRLSGHPNAVNVTTVHDFSYRMFVTNPLKRYIHCSQMFRAIRMADHVVCISENTRKDLFRFLPDVPKDKVSVIYNGVDNKFFPMEDSCSQDFVLFVGKRDRYKNFNALVAPLAELGRSIKIVGVPLTADEEALMRQSGLQYEYCGIVTDEELNRLYNEAFCLLYTSLYEGFGLPVLEAQMAGCPVVAMDSSSIPEVIGDKRMLLSEITAESLQEKFQLLFDSTARASVIAHGMEKAHSFSWDRMGQEYYELYSRLLNQ